MSIAARPQTAPRVVVGCWAASLAVGSVLIAIGPAAPAREPLELSPYSLAAYLERVAGPEAREIRVNSFYGSGHGGGWQFVAHLTWVDGSGQVRGGTTSLPQLAGADAIVSNFDVARLKREQAIGWTLRDLDGVLDQVEDVNAVLAMLELEIDASGAGDVLYCHAAVAEARCEARSRVGRRTRQFEELLTDEPLRGPLAVQRASRPLQG